MDVVLVLHSHLPYVLHHGRWPHGSDWLAEATIDSYLPLLEMLHRVRDSGTRASLTIGVTPVLASQLTDPAFAGLLESYFDQREAACADAPRTLAETGDAGLIPLAAFWSRRLKRLRALFRSIHGDLVGAFAALEQSGTIEITSSAATHGFLPLLHRPESIDLQLGLGRSEHRRIFGRAPRGCWIPECAYRPGLEHHVTRAGFEYFFADAHVAQAGEKVDVYGTADAAREVTTGPARKTPERSPYRAYRVGGCTVLLRDPVTSRQVWSRHEGYPGDEHYLEFHKIRWPEGLRLWRVSAGGSDLADKLPYRPEAARTRAGHHARHFVSLLRDTSRGAGDRDAAIVAPFDTELFGHWWFEGPEFLGNVLDLLDRTRTVQPATASASLAKQPATESVQLEQGSWGANGDFSMWKNERTAWTWTRLRDLEETFWRAARPALADERLHFVLAQAARELLLAQSSDWQFIITTGNAADYAEKRFKEHCDQAEGLMIGLQASEFIGPTTHLAELHGRKNRLFPDILPAIAAALSAR
jgi:1,4-alpha-glucan branching enzyme